MKLVIAFALALTLGACSSLGTVISTVGAATTVYNQVKAYYGHAPKTVFAARAGFDIALTAAAHFKQDVCPNVTSQPFCKTVVPILRTGAAKTVAALDVAENFVRANPTLDATAAINAAEAAVTAFAKTETDNGVPAK